MPPKYLYIIILLLFSWIVIFVITAIFVHLQNKNTKNSHQIIHSIFLQWQINNLNLTLGFFTLRIKRKNIIEITFCLIFIYIAPNHSSHLNYLMFKLFKQDHPRSWVIAQWSPCRKTNHSRQYWDRSEGMLGLTDKTSWLLTRFPQWFMQNNLINLLQSSTYWQFVSPHSVSCCFYCSSLSHVSPGGRGSYLSSHICSFKGDLSFGTRSKSTHVRGKLVVPVIGCWLKVVGCWRFVKGAGRCPGFNNSFAVVKCLFRCSGHTSPGPEWVC